MKPTIYLRFPFNRNGFNDPVMPTVKLSTSQTDELIHKLVSAESIDWQKQATHYNMSVIFLVQLAFHLYDKRGKQLEDATQKENWLNKLVNVKLSQVTSTEVNMASHSSLEQQSSGPSVPSLTKSQESRDKSSIALPFDDNDNDNDAVFASVDNGHSDGDLFSSRDLEGVTASALEAAILSAMND